MKKIYALLALFFSLFIAENVNGQDPNVSVYFANAQNVSSNVFRFDIMIKAVGTTSTFQLRTFQAGIFLNPTFANGGTVYIDNVSSSLVAPGYNGSFQWNPSDNFINCSVNTGVRTASGCISTVTGTTELKIATIQISNTTSFSTCVTPDLKFNYVQSISPLRLRTSVSWRSGTGCTTNYDMFYPNRTYTGQAYFNNELYSINDADGSSPVITAANPQFCFSTLNLTAFIEGYYLGGGAQQPALISCGVNRSTSLQADTITVELRPASNPSTVSSKYQGILNTNGTAQVAFPTSLIGQQCYIVLKHRNSIETWSASPVTVAASMSYNFSNAANKAYGNNLQQVAAGVWAIYSGDISDAILGVGYQDGVVESQDYADMENANYITKVGYAAEDLTGDGVVESADYALIENANYVSVFSIHP